MGIWTRKYWEATTERVVASFAGGVISTFSVDATGAFDAFQADWPTALSIGTGAAVVSLLKALGANKVTRDGPGVTHAERVVIPDGDGRHRATKPHKEAA